MRDTVSTSSTCNFCNQELGTVDAIAEPSGTRAHVSTSSTYGLTKNTMRAADSTDPWTRRARPAFLYVMYALLLWSIPIGLIAAVQPAAAVAIAQGMTTYLRGIPEELYALFGTGYLGYTAARAWGKAKGVEP